MALFAALALTSVIGLLVAGAVASTRLSQRSWRVAATDASLTAAADYALAGTLADARRLGFADLALGRATSIDVTVPNAPEIRATVSITRLPLGVLWLVAQVTADGVDQGSRRINLIARFPWIGRVPPAAIVARGDVELAADVTVGADTSQDPDCAVRANREIAVAPDASVQGVDSTRVLRTDAALDTATYYLAAKQLDALHRSGRFSHVLGDTTIGGGAFEGILIVDGSLTIAGPFVGEGLFIARGPIVSSGPVTLIGAVLSYAPQATQKLAIKFSGATIRYSSCAVERSLRRALDVRPVFHRSWAELF